MNTALIFWVFCIGYPVFTLLQSIALIWLIWYFQDEISLKIVTMPVWRPPTWFIRGLIHWSPHSTTCAPARYDQVDEASSLASEVHA
jgi:hypothetical protein